MAESDKVFIDDVEYDVTQMTEAQQILLAHVRDLDQQIGRRQFKLDQLRVGRETFVKQLKALLETPTA